MAGIKAQSRKDSDSKSTPGGRALRVPGLPDRLSPCAGRSKPVIENVAPADHQLRIELEGYKPETSIVSVNKGDQKYFRLIRLVRLPFATPAVAPSPPES